MPATLRPSHRAVMLWRLPLLLSLGAGPITAAPADQTPAPSHAAAAPAPQTSKANQPDAITPDGGRYFGPLRNGLMHGQGRMEWPNGRRYVGGFENGLFSGQGQMQSPDGSEHLGQYRAGVAHGMGRLRFPNGDIYTGPFAGDLPEGQGKLEVEDLGTFTGSFQKGQLQGVMALAHVSGIRYEGQMEDGAFSGPGRITLPDGTVIEGELEGDAIHGEGSVRYPDGNHYSGELLHSEPHGKGHMRYANGDEYRGEFLGGMPFGEGAMRYAKRQADGRRTVKGHWVAGHLQQEPSQAPAPSQSSLLARLRAASDTAPDTPAQWQANVETALYNQNTLLARTFAQLRPHTPGQSDLYALLVAGDGTQEVFRREVTQVHRLLDRQYGTQGRSIALINSRTDVERTPLATQHSLRASLSALAKVMDPAEDVLLLFLTSHGSPEHALSLQMRGMDLRDLPAQTLAQILRESGIQRRIVVVSACYSGGFIEPLKDEHTLIITAARADRTSFGCADDNDFTYFGRAFFGQALAQPGATLSAAFAHASALVQQWEGEHGPAQAPTQTQAANAAQAQRTTQYSEPQMHGTPAWVAWLDQQWLRWGQAHNTPPGKKPLDGR